MWIPEGNEQNPTESQHDPGLSCWGRVGIFEKSDAEMFYHVLSILQRVNSHDSGQQTLEDCHAAKPVQPAADTVQRPVFCVGICLADCFRSFFFGRAMKDNCLGCPCVDFGGSFGFILSHHVLFYFSFGT